MLTLLIVRPAIAQATSEDLVYPIISAPHNLFAWSFLEVLDAMLWNEVLFGGFLEPQVQRHLLDPFEAF